MIYAALGFAAVSLVSLVLVMRWGMRAKDEAGHAADRLYGQTKMADETIMALVADRDSWKQKADVAAVQLAAAKVRLVTAETQRNAALQAKREHVVEVVRTSDASTGIALLGGVLSRPLPRMPQAPAARTSDGRGDSADVRPADSTDSAGGTGRLPKP